MGLEGMVANDQLNILQIAVDQHALLPQQLEEMIGSYLTRDLNRLFEVAMRQLEETDPDMMAYFKEDGIDKRNRIMFGRLQSMLSEYSVFAAIGALHLGGDTGLIRLLQEAGFEVTPVW